MTRRQHEAMRAKGQRKEARAQKAADKARAEFVAIYGEDGQWERDAAEDEATNAFYAALDA